ncbi:MAG: CCA tRNA nucleotidyltransferase [Candidatus Delongbacteria bacterium]|nr:CCA tRNA nucleotidyltransferase [Candidatus Delongbacteria bacterium]MCG2761125.1 CCA tRNA nucleotidyltransferase [Candidatus Delongbacteria bacterium]
MKMIIEPEIFKAICMAEKSSGYKCFVVGGYIRNHLLGLKSDDIDFVIEGDSLLFAEKVAEILGRRKVIKFPRFKTAKVVYKKKSIEFVSARSEKYEPDSRKPAVENSTLFNDLSRRDFTINALAAEITEFGVGEIIDHFGGMNDLQKRILRTPLSPVETYSEDPLRMLRCIRFASTLNFNIERKSFEAITSNVERLDIVSVERISDEFFKILSSINPVKGILLLYRTNLIKKLFPEIADLTGMDDRGGIRHKDVFVHTLKVLYNISKTTDKLELRLAALMHDIGKPKTKYFKNEQGWTFHGHDEKGAELFNEIAKKFKWSNGISDYVSKIIRLHHRPISLTKEEVTDSGVRRLLYEGGESVDDLMLLCRADITTANKNKLKKYLENFDKLSNKILEVEEKDKLRNFKPPINGVDIMTAFNEKEGPTIGRIKKIIVDAILSGEIGNNRESAIGLLNKLIIEEKAMK